MYVLTCEYMCVCVCVKMRAAAAGGGSAVGRPEEN